MASISIKLSKEKTIFYCYEMFGKENEFDSLSSLFW
jgi:hypothetical protein